MGLIPDLETKIPHALGQLNPCTTTAEAIELLGLCMKEAARGSLYYSEKAISATKQNTYSYKEPDTAQN